MNEDQLEQHCLEWFRANSWEVEYGPDIDPDSDKPERSDYREVTLKRYLQESLEKINPHLPFNAIEQAIALVLKSENLDLITNNHAFHCLLLEGVPVEYRKDDETIHDHAFLIDFENIANNRFLAVNQFTILGTKRPRRLDVVCFINGLPIAVLELKSPNDENADIWSAFNQLQTYKDEISDFFVFNEALVVSDGYNARIGALTANQERFSPWRAVKNEDDKPLLEWQLETLVQGFFDRELLLDYIRFFVLFENDGGVLFKKIASYHQFHAVREAVRATIIASQEIQGVAEKRTSYGDEVVPDSKKAGVV